MLQQMLQQYFDTPHDIPLINLTVGTHDPNRDNSKFRASDAGKCHRMRYWKRQGKEGKQDIPFEVHMALQTGNLLHAFIQYALGEMGVLFASEQELKDHHRIGHLDAIIRNRDAEYILYDFKTIGGKQMYYLKQDLKPKPEHIHQVLTYQQIYINTESGKQEYVSIDKCVIGYISRDTMEILELPVPENFHVVNDDWQALIDYWERQEMPPMTRSGWECKYCQYNADCPQKRG